MTDEYDDERFHMVQTGAEAEKFLRTRLGQYCVSRVEDTIKRAYEELEIVHPSNEEKIRSNLFSYHLFDSLFRASVAPIHLFTGSLSTIPHSCTGP